MYDKLKSLEGTRLLWGAILVNCICGWCSHWFHNVILNVMEDTLTDYLRGAFIRTHGWNMSDSRLSYVYCVFVVSIWSFGAIVGAPIAHLCLERFSRRNSLMLYQNCINLLAAFLCLLAMWTDVPEFLMVGRFLFGTGSGFYNTVVGLFLTEITPISVRGVATCIGIAPAIVFSMFTMFLGFPMILGKHYLWAYVMLVGVLPCVIPLCTFWLFPKRNF